MVMVSLRETGFAIPTALFAHTEQCSLYDLSGQIETSAHDLLDDRPRLGNDATILALWGFILR